MALVAPAVPVELSSEQQAVAESVLRWWRGDSGQVFKLHGYAGTGKTTVLREILAEIKRSSPSARMHWAAPTGMAARILSEKGLRGATTLHRSGLIYGYSTRWKSGPPYRLGGGEALLDQIDLLVVDETSMIGESLVNDILNCPDLADRRRNAGRRRGLRVLAVGDPAQLAPVNDGHAPWAVEGSHDARLETIHRSAEDSVIVQAATAARQGDLATMKRLLGGSVTMADLLAVDQIITGGNETRWHVIENLRIARGLPVAEPVPGDRLILLKNKAGLGVNGDQLTVRSVARSRTEKGLPVFEIRFTDGLEAMVPVAMFAGLDGEKEGLQLAGGRGSALAPLTFAEAITVHKSQGSEWESVVVVDDESYATREKGWAYTAVTRARKSVAVASRDQLPPPWTLHEARALRDEWANGVWTDQHLSHTVRVTALALVDSVGDGESIRVGADLDAVAKDIDRKPSTVANHMTTLRKAGWLRGSGGLTTLSFPERSVERPSTLQQLYGLVARQAEADDG